MKAIVETGEQDLARKQTRLDSEPNDRKVPTSPAVGEGVGLVFHKQKGHNYYWIKP